MSIDPNLVLVALFSILVVGVKGLFWAWERELGRQATHLERLVRKSEGQLHSVEVSLRKSAVEKMGVKNHVKTLKSAIEGLKVEMAISTEPEAPVDDVSAELGKSTGSESTRIEEASRTAPEDDTEDIETADGVRPPRMQGKPSTAAGEVQARKDPLGDVAESAELSLDAILADGDAPITEKFNRLAELCSALAKRAAKKG